MNKQNIYNYIRVISIIIGSTIFILSCVNNKNLLRAQDNPKEKSILSAVERFSQLKSEGKVPGLKTNEHGRLKSSGYSMLESTNICYPQTITLEITKIGEENFTYWYLLYKQNENGEWSIKDAWKIDNRTNIKSSLYGQKTHLTGNDGKR